MFWEDFYMVITVCIGSSCHLKGSREIVKTLESLISLYNLKDKVELNGSFCMENCLKGVCVKINEDVFSLEPKNTELFFKEEVLRRLGDECNQL
jgi:NADH:ubiquinone oxidoreductase subunit E